MRHGALAQLVEQLTLNQPVPGSSPGRLTFNSVTSLLSLLLMSGCRISVTVSAEVLQSLWERGSCCRKLRR
jgi:hypothetical protein